MLAAGNARFMADERAHPHQDVHFRHRVAARQNPFAIFFGCADSRVAAEIIFDQGLGDLFVVRTAGHVIDPSVLGSLEFGVGVLDCPLIVVLGHDSCGAVKAAEVAVRTGEVPGRLPARHRRAGHAQRPRRLPRRPHPDHRGDRARARRAHLRPDQRALHAHRRPHPLRSPGRRRAPSTTSPTARPRWCAPSATSGVGRVIRLDGLHLHPVKSTAVRRVLHGDVEPWGLRRRPALDGRRRHRRVRHGPRGATRCSPSPPTPPATDPGLAAALRLQRPGPRTRSTSRSRTGRPLPSPSTAAGWRAVAAPDEAGALVRRASSAATTCASCTCTARGRSTPPTPARARPPPSPTPTR